VPLAAVLLSYIAMRCVLLATMENPEQRYTMMMFPIVFLAAGCALAGRTELNSFHAVHGD
jgi:hypothetical protein